MHDKPISPPICWICDRKLYHGGRSYRLVTDADTGHEHPAHVSCARAPAETQAYFRAHANKRTT